MRSVFFERIVMKRVVKLSPNVINKIISTSTYFIVSNKFCCKAKSIHKHGGGTKPQ